MTKELSIETIEEICGSKERTLFFLTWLKHDRNATKAYMEIHPNIKEKSANVLGSRMLGNIDIKLVAQAYGLDTHKYMKVLSEAMDASKWNDFTGEREADFKTIKPYHDKLGKLLGIETEQPTTQINLQNVINTQKESYKLDE